MLREVRHLAKDAWDEIAVKHFWINISPVLKVGAVFIGSAMAGYITAEISQPFVDQFIKHPSTLDALKNNYLVDTIQFTVSYALTQAVNLLRRDEDDVTERRMWRSHKVASFIQGVGIVAAGVLGYMYVAPWLEPSRIHAALAYQPSDFATSRNFYALGFFVGSTVNAICNNFSRQGAKGSIYGHK